MTDDQTASNYYKTKTEEIIRDKFPYVLVGGTILFFALLSAAILMKPMLSSNQNGFFAKLERFIQGDVTPTPSPAQAMTTYKVATGESLSSIAQKVFGTEAAVNFIAEANNITPTTLLQVGQELRIPSLTLFTATQGKGGLAMVGETQISAAPTKILDISPTVVVETPQMVEATKTVVISPQPIQNTALKEYKVVANDSLWQIANSTYGTGYAWADIAAANSLSNPNQLAIGMMLKLPQVPDQKLAQFKAVQVPDSGQMLATATVRADTSVTKYVVQHGDNLWNIALKLYGDGQAWQKIAQVNHLANPRIIHTGNVLAIPR